MEDGSDTHAHMQAPKFEPSLTFGNLVNLVVLLVSLGVAWGVHRSTVSNLEDSISQLKSTDTEIRLALSSKEVQITNLMIASVRQDQKLESIAHSLDKLVRWVENQQNRPIFPDASRHTSPSGTDR